ncbi:MAG: ABC transporter ATP-binding protein, partial [Caldilineaceae bacterium]
AMTATPSLPAADRAPESGAPIPASDAQRASVAVVQVDGLQKRYGDTLAVADVSFTIGEGEIFGLLGPNGAGKSSTISILSCLLPPDGGRATVLGHDVVADSRTVRGLIGVVPQEIALYPTLTARENLTFFGEMYGLRGRELRMRADEVLDIVAMRDRANDRVDTYSGGMKRRINMAVGLIHRPRLLFLDEPTVGVDPQSRNHIFESVERLNREQGMTILYTTHYMEEAERLCHRVGIIDRGHLIALDTPRALVGLLGGGIVRVGLGRADEELRLAVATLPSVASAAWAEEPASPVEGAGVPAVSSDQVPTAGGGRVRLVIETKRQESALVEIVHLLGRRGTEMLSLETLEPNLESVFLRLTGKTLRN